MILRCSTIYMCVMLGATGARITPAWGQTPTFLTTTEMNRIIRRGVLPYTLEDLTGRLQALIRHDRPALRSRIWRLMQAYYRYEALRRAWPLLNATRDNLSAIYTLHRQQQERAEVDDLAVLRAHNAVIEADLQLVQQERTRRLVLLEILETALLLDLAEDGHGPTPADRGADPGGN